MFLSVFKRSFKIFWKEKRQDQTNLNCYRTILKNTINCTPTISWKSNNRDKSNKRDRTDHTEHTNYTQTQLQSKFMILQFTLQSNREL